MKELTEKLKNLFEDNKKIFIGILKLSPIIILCFVILFNFLFEKERDMLLTLSSGSPGGAYYPLGGGIAEIVTTGIPQVRMDSESTSGSIENVRLVGNSQSDLGMVMESACFKGIEGIYPFDRKYPVKALFNMYPAPLHIVTVEGSGIESIYDLAGKRVSVDSPGSGAEEMAMTILEELDLVDSVRTYNYGQSDAAAALRDGNIDAVFWNFAYPGSAVMEVSATRNIKLIPLEEEDMDKIIENNPYFSKDIIPSGTYSGQDKDVDVLSVNNLIIVRKDMDADLVYDLLDIIFSQTDKLKEIHRVAEHISIENATDTSIEMHEGAIRYFNEHGK